MAPSLLPTLREQVRARAENRPGVYRFLGPGGELLYVGKSIRVRSRLLSYFTAPRGEKAWNLVRDAAGVEWEYVPNEFGALVTEMRLIQRHRPRYNVEHKRKRRYAFLKVTREPAPRVVPTGRVVSDGSLYFGPFPRVRRLADAVRDLSYVMGLRDCASATPIFFDDQLEMFGGGGNRSPRCLRADLGTCLAPCCGRTSSSEYRRRVQQTVRFLEGRGREPLRRLEARMADAVHRREFEYAATMRDRVERLRRFQGDLTAWRGRVESLSFVYRVPGFRGADRVYFVRRGLVRGWAPHPKTPAARADVAQRVRRVFADAPARPAGLEPREAAEILFVARWFARREKELGRTTPPTEWLERAGAA
jgi:excinuclease ABC subunit C